jgi:LPXTG-motif cell wall-anchored protein
MGPEAEGRRREPVPGTVRLMTDTPIEMPLSAAGGQSSFAEQLEERPWLLAVGALVALGFFLVLRRRHDR